MNPTRPRILAIDDTPANLMTLGSALHGDFDVQIATSGMSGLKLALATPPSLILLDVMMPELNGFEVCKLFKAEPSLKDVPVIFLTALTDPDSEALGLSLGAVDYITKPINVGIACQRVRNLIEREQLRLEVNRQRDSLALALSGKTSLLHELHNRVRGNLQVVNSLLRLESKRAQQAETIGALGEMEGRIRCLALLHESLEHSETHAVIDLGKYLELLTKQAIRMIKTGNVPIRLRTDLSSVTVSADQAVPCGLLVNELISNCIKHGFPEGQDGEIHVELRLQSDGRHVHVCVSDSGVEWIAATLEKNSTSLSSQIVSDLAKQLGGTVGIVLGQGTRFSMCFAIS